jgi:predicted ATPase/class 3 adenylate cyclase
VVQVDEAVDAAHDSRGMRSELPGGTVTFLFTDVEGSTRLLHELGAEGYADALAEHRRVIREACAGEGGKEVDTQGDAFFFAFPTATGAVSAASTLSEALAHGPIRVRVGLHTGTPLLTEEGYVGNDVHLAARVAGSGHGGQVVLTSATASHVDAGLVDLGEHRLKDIDVAVLLYQLGEASFPPLKTISNTNLPRPASSFLGRERELEEVLSRIEAGARLLTLTGPGGTGKTRLAIEAASSLVGSYKAGVFWVGLASFRDPTLVTETISQTLGAKDGLAAHIGERELLLLLDNVEQVVEAAPELSALVNTCPNLALLVTSRELLRVQGEVEYPVPPLAEPEAVALFCERAQTEPSAEVSELCARLDNLPLAVELAAARAKALSPTQILERLSGRLDLLRGGRDADPRQQTLRATIEWSYDLLSPEERLLFGRLSVFAGGCTLEAAEEVCDADLDTLQSLVEKSLLRFDGGRYWMLETIREYAEERLEEGREAESLRRRHAEYLRREVRELAVDLRRLHSSALEWIALEQHNVRSAFTWAASEDIELAAELLNDLTTYWILQGRASEALHLAESISGVESAPPEIRALVLSWKSEALRFLGRRQESRALIEEVLPIFEQLGDERQVIASLKDLAQEYAAIGDLPRARDRIGRAMERARATGDQERVGHVVVAKGVVAFLAGDFEEAEACFASTLPMWETLNVRGEVGYAHLMIGECAWRRGRLDEALTELQAALTISVETGDRQSLPEIFDELAAVAARRDQVVLAARLLGAACRLREEINVPVWDAVELERTTSMLCEALGRSALDAETAIGRDAPDAVILANAAAID